MSPLYPGYCISTLIPLKYNYNNNNNVLSKTLFKTVTGKILINPKYDVYPLSHGYILLSVLKKCKKILVHVRTNHNLAYHFFLLMLKGVRTLNIFFSQTKYIYNFYELISLLSSNTHKHYQHNIQNAA